MGDQENALMQMMRPANRLMKHRSKARMQQLARSFTEPALLELARIAGILTTTKRDKQGRIILDEYGQPITVIVPGSLSDATRVRAIEILFERGWGKVSTSDQMDLNEAKKTIERVERRIIPARPREEFDVGPDLVDGEDLPDAPDVSDDDPETIDITPNS